uniref:Uncharacterized protein n=1 Tax=Romanomermis culicivorax TaxID=13658 RepID=A0A915JY03_ROMCU
MHQVKTLKNLIFTAVGKTHKLIVEFLVKNKPKTRETRLLSLSFSIVSRCADEEYIGVLQEQRKYFNDRVAMNLSFINIP